jgi:TRAP-type C4-dicarboxylate transport system substrate-binding protein
MAYRQLAAACAAALLLAPTASRAADPILLRYAFPAPPQSKVDVWGSHPWRDDVMKAANGALDIKLFPGNSIVTVQTSYDRTVAGVSDITFGIFGPLAGVFRKVNVTELPFEADSDLESSLALWRLWKQGLINDEFEKVKVLALFTFPAPAINTNKPIQKMDDMKGLKFAVASRVLAELVTAVGGTPITLGPPEFYEAAQRGTVNGVFVGWSAVQTFKLAEVTKYHVDTGAGYAPAFMIMNKQSFARLPKAAQDAIDKYSGEPYFERMGKVTDAMDEEGRKQVQAMPDHKVTKLTPEQVETWRKAAAPIYAGWEERTPNGKAVLAAFRKAVADIRAGK